jgi:hypothetical protein
MRPSSGNILLVCIDEADTMIGYLHPCNVLWGWRRLWNTRRLEENECFLMRLLYHDNFVGWLDKSVSKSVLVVRKVRHVKIICMTVNQRAFVIIISYLSRAFSDGSYRLSGLRMSSARFPEPQVAQVCGDACIRRSPVPAWHS